MWRLVRGSATGAAEADAKGKLRASAFHVDTDEPHPFATAAAAAAANGKGEANGLVLASRLVEVRPQSFQRRRLRTVSNLDATSGSRSGGPEEEEERFASAVAPPQPPPLPVRRNREEPSSGLLASRWTPPARKSTSRPNGMRRAGWQRNGSSPLGIRQGLRFDVQAKTGAAPGPGANGCGEQGKKSPVPRSPKSPAPDV